MYASVMQNFPMCVGKYVHREKKDHFLPKLMGESNDNLAWFNYMGNVLGLPIQSRFRGKETCIYIEKARRMLRVDGYAYNDRTEQSIVLEWLGEQNNVKF